MIIIKAFICKSSLVLFKNAKLNITRSSSNVNSYETDFLERTFEFDKYGNLWGVVLEENTTWNETKAM